MMRVIADLHIHSRFSRATSPRLTLPHLDRWARIKGIDLVGSGDCTHPAWLSELREQLDEGGTAEEGFFTLKENVRREFDAGEALVMGLPKPPNHMAAAPRFVLTGEVSTIYKSGDKTRKVHHLLILPDFKAAIRFQTLLERHGKITSDGRPILGISSRELFSLLLEADERALLIPAHIWTPWFSAMGAKSGFDSIEECYGDLASRIFAVETGLSSNPPMNWAVSALNRFSIISNSDAHSPEKLGRECTIFNMDMSLSALSAALHFDSDGARVEATIEFFPQEGKYHYDGHRKCGFFLPPEEALAQAGVCPVCHKPLTRGVMGRVMELAAGVVDETLSCPLEEAEKSNRRPYYSLIPLKELLGELLETGVSSKKVGAVYHALIQKAGPELQLLMETPLDAIEKLRCPDVAGETLAAALKRMREGQVSIQPGYDGEYGVIHAFPPKSVRRTAPQRAIPQQYAAPQQSHVPNVVGRHAVSLSPEQQDAVLYEGSHALIIAGPGSGKTATLAACIARLAQGGSIGGIVALSFTVKAALELRERIASTAVDTSAITTATFHSLCTSILREQASAAGVSAEFRILNDTERDAVLRELCDRETSRTRAEGLGKYIEARKRFLLLPGEHEPPNDCLNLALLVGELGLPPMKADEERLYTAYRERLRVSDTMDFDDLVVETVRLLAGNPDLLTQYHQRFRAVFVDEYQDINFAQYALIQLLAPKGNGRLLRVIGDPNQAIYGFRGSDKRFIDRFFTDYPDARCFHLSESFRCAASVIDAALSLVDEGAAFRGAQRTVRLFRAEYPTEKSEAERIARRISRLIGGTTFFAFDSGIADDAAAVTSLDECAILLRTLSLAPPIIKALGDHGIPFELSGETPWWEKEPLNALLTFLREHKPSASIPPDRAIQAAWKQLVKNKAVKIPRGNRESVDAGVNRLSDMARFFDTLSTFLDTLTLSDATTGEGMTHSGVAIMSIHASKGLEFDYVFVAGLEEGFLPFTLYETEHIPSERLDEEKRLLYVAMTRARHGLYLSYAKKRLFQGRTLSAGKSRFFDRLETVPVESALPARKRDQQLSLF
jgi:uncharacterized protein (TIGR00375 family)